MNKIVTLRFDIDGDSYLIPCYKNTAIQITKRVGDLDSLTSQGTITKQTFRVPFTQELIDAIGDLTDLGQDSLININQSIKGSVLVNLFPRFRGSFQIIKAYLEPKSGMKQCEFAFLGNETDLKSELQKIKMAELFDGELLTYSAAEIDSYLSDPFVYRNTNGYMWPFVDYGQRYTADPSATVGTILDVGGTPLTQLNFKPSVTLEKCFDMMPIDVTYDSSIDDLMRHTILLHNVANSIPILDTSPLDYTGYMDRSSIGSQALTASTYAKLVFNREYNYNVDQIDLINSEYDIPITGLYTFRVKGDIEFTTTNVGITNYPFSLKLADGGTVGGGLLYFYNPPSISSGNPTTVSLDFNYTSFQTANQAISLNIEVTTDSNCTINLQQDFRFEMVASPSITASSNVDIAANCPDLTAWDIFSGVTNMCKGNIETNSDGTYNLIPWIDWIDSNSEVINLNDKIEPSTIQIEPFSLKGAKSILLTYKEDEDLYNKAYKDIQGGVYGQLLIEDTGTDFTKEQFKVELPWAATVPVPIESTGAPIPKLFDSDYKVIKGKPRLLPNYNGEYLLLSFDLQDVFGGTTYTYSVIPNMTNWSSISGGYDETDSNFGKSLTFFSQTGYPKNTLYERFWKQYIEETFTEGSRQVTANVRLTQNLIDGLEFNERVYYQNTFFRFTALNNINITTEEPVQVTMMKRLSFENIDVAPFYPFDVAIGIVQWKDSSDNSTLSPADGSGANQADLQESAIAYGYFYDSVKLVAVEQGQILEI